MDDVFVLFFLSVTCGAVEIFFGNAKGRFGKMKQGVMRFLLFLFATSEAVEISSGSTKERIGKMKQLMMCFLLFLFTTCVVGVAL